jgi:murein L,D-transpeptidase YafK
MSLKKSGDMVRFLLACGAAIVLLQSCFPPVAWAQTREPTSEVDSILVLKKDHVLELLAGGKVIRSYKVALGTGGLASKERQGDGRTPEGRYVIDSRNEHSAFYKSLHISYPDAEDHRRAARLGVSPGGDIMIHGLPNGRGWIGPAHRLYDWTEGCIAVTDDEMDEIWKLVPVGTPVEIRP